MRDDEVVIRRVKTIGELTGIFRESARDVNADWNTVRGEMQDIVAKRVADE